MQTRTCKKAARARAEREGIAEDVGWQEFQKNISKKAFKKLVEGSGRKKGKKRAQDDASVIGSVSHRRSVHEATGEVEIHDPRVAAKRKSKKKKKSKKKIAAKE